MCIIDTPMGQELIAELNSFEVDFTSARNMPVDVRSKDHRGDLVIATALALWSAIARPSTRIEVATNAQAQPVFLRALHRFAV